MTIMVLREKRTHLAEAEEDAEGEEEYAAPGVEDGGGLADGDLDKAKGVELLAFINRHRCSPGWQCFPRPPPPTPRLLRPRRPP